MENQLDNYIKSLVESNTPHLVLASIFNVLFDRSIQPREWGQLRKLINIYGRWRVLESFLRASGNEFFDASSKGVWGYFTTICISLLEDERNSQENIFRYETIKKQTLEMVEQLANYDSKIEVKDKSWLICNNV